MSRDSQTDAGRIGSARQQTKANMAYQYTMPGAKGVWEPAYSRGRGVRDDDGEYCDEVGNGRDDN